jgi:hypothetical protein
VWGTAGNKQEIIRLLEMASGCQNVQVRKTFL